MASPRFAIIAILYCNVAKLFVYKNIFFLKEIYSLNCSIQSFNLSFNTLKEREKKKKSTKP